MMSIGLKTGERVQWTASFLISLKTGDVLELNHLSAQRRGGAVGTSLTMEPVTGEGWTSLLTGRYQCCGAQAKRRNSERRASAGRALSQGWIDREETRRMLPKRVVPNVFGCVRLRSLAFGGDNSRTRRLTGDGVALVTVCHWLAGATRAMPPKAVAFNAPAFTSIESQSPQFRGRSRTVAAAAASE